MRKKKKISYFLILLSGFVDFSTLGFSYKGYSTNILHTLQITTVSDYVMSFLEKKKKATEKKKNVCSDKPCVFC